MLMLMMLMMLMMMMMMMMMNADDADDAADDDDDDDNVLPCDVRLLHRMCGSLFLKTLHPIQGQYVLFFILA